MPCPTATLQGESEAPVHEAHVRHANKQPCLKTLNAIAIPQNPCLLQLSSIAPQNLVFFLQLRVRGDLALGYVALDAVVQRSLQLSNSGLNTATYRVEVEAGLPLQVTPADGKLGPTGTLGSTCTLKVELTAEISGPLSGMVHDCEGSRAVHCGSVQ